MTRELPMFEPAPSGTPSAHHGGSELPISIGGGGFAALPAADGSVAPRRHPDWIRARMPSGDNYHDLKRLLRGLELNTVCEEAHCPNIGECWDQRTATIMILGDTCTRACGFCAVKTGRPTWFDDDEPRRVAQAALPASALADRLLEPPDSLQIVVEDVRARIHDDLKRRVITVEIRDQDLDSHPGRGVTHLADRLREDARPTVGQVIAGDTRDHDVLQAERADRLGDASRFVVVEPGRPAGLHRAEPACPGAGVTEDHDRRGALVPALSDVRAVGLFADGVQRQPA